MNTPTESTEPAPAPVPAPAPPGPRAGTAAAPEPPAPEFTAAEGEAIAASAGRRLLDPETAAAGLAAWPAEPAVYRPAEPDHRALLPASDLRRLAEHPPPPPAEATMVRGSTVTGHPPSVDHPEDTFSVWAADSALPRLAALCRGVERAWGHPARATVYCTPAHGEGFLPHWDVTPVALLQVEGAKRWRLRRPVVAEPSERSHRFAARGFTEEERESLARPDFECEVTAGEVLWIPRGWVHWGQAGAASSVHVTISIHQRTWRDEIIRVLDAREADAELRAAAPPMPGGVPGPGADDAALDLLRRWLDSNSRREDRS